MAGHVYISLKVQALLTSATGSEQDVEETVESKSRPHASSVLAIVSSL